MRGNFSEFKNAVILTIVIRRENFFAFLLFRIRNQFE
jgi:hypothetical protein